MSTSLASLRAGHTPAPRIREYRLRRGAGIDGLALHDTDTAALGPHDIRVAVKAVALNQRDLMVARGVSGIADRAIVPGSDAAGVVIEIGAGVTGWRVGDRVFSTFFPDWLDGPPTEASTARAPGGTLDGVLAESVVLPETAWVAVPEHLDFIEAATLGCAALTAWHALFELEPLRPGATLAVLGTGGVSVWALQLAKAAGLRVIVTSSDDGKLARARALGADATLNYRRTPAWGAALRDLSGGDGVDRVIEVGGQGTLEQSIDALRMGGSIAIVGRLSGLEPARFDASALYGGLKRLSGVLVGSRAMSRSLARFVEHRQLRPVVDRVFAFEQAREAYAYLERAAHLGKVVVAVDPETRA